jgi:hypothetical protein
MIYTTVYDIANDSVDLQFTLIGLVLVIAGAVMKWGFRKPGWNGYAVMGLGLFLILATGAVPWWDQRRVAQAVARGEARQVEGPIHDWRLARVSRKRKSTDPHAYIHYEYFSVGPVAFRIEWGAPEAGFANRGSTEKKPTVRLANGIFARIWYLPIDGPDKPPRIVRIDLGAGSWADAVRQGAGGTAFRLLQGRVADEANVLPADRKARLDALLDAFAFRSGHRLAVVTTPSLGGIDIARYAAEIARQRGLDRAGAESGILLLVAPNERKARIAVGPGLTERLPDAAAQQIMDGVVLPPFRRGDIPAGIEAGAAAIIGRVTAGETR